MCICICIHEFIQYQINRKMSLLTSKLNIELRKKNCQDLCLEDCTVWLRDLNTRKIGAEVFRELRNVCWRRMEKIKWSEKVLEHMGEKRHFQIISYIEKPILSFNLRLGILKGLFPAGVPVKILKVLLPSFIHAIWPANLSITKFRRAYYVKDSLLNNIRWHNMQKLLSPLKA